MINPKTYPRISLLNCEGDILIAYKTPTDYMIMDQWGVCVDVLTENELDEFFSGTYEITDSKSRTWNYLKEHKDMKPSADKLDLFLKLKVKEQE